ncbi:hypothetical protein VXC91_46315, partial [Streptomyces chiangmaiensis]|nr:hypothetical protein [Streptomyces chiangmaiensis]
GNSFVGGSFNFALARYQGGGIPQPSLTITKSHSGNFTHGGTYSITVGNSGPGATDGTITVKDTLPAGLTASSISGSGWTCTLATLTCTRSDLLAAGAAYPPITLKAKASCHTQRQDSATVTKGGDRKVTNTATVTGGGDTTTHTAADTTAIHGDKHCGNDHDHGNDRNHRNP